MLRAGALSVVVVVVSLTAHLAGGGSLPSRGLLSVVCLAVAWVTVLTTTGPLSGRRVLAVLGAGQLALHEVFMASSHAVALTGSTAPMSAGVLRASGSMTHPMPHHVSGAVAAVTAAAPAPPGAAGMTPAGTGSPMLMSLCHVAATLVLAAVLLRGERALLALIALWSRWAPRVPARAVAPRVHVRRVLLRVPASVRHRCALVVTSPRRGPPAPALS